MKFEKIEFKREAWAINIGGRIIPLDAIKTTLLPIFIVICVAMALNIGSNTMAEYVKLSAYLAENGVYNPETNTYEKCYPEHSGTNIIWKCGEPENNSMSYQDFINRKY